MSSVSPQFILNVSYSYVHWIIDEAFWTGTVLIDIVFLNIAENLGFISN